MSQGTEAECFLRAAGLDPAGMTSHAWLLDGGYEVRDRFIARFGFAVLTAAVAAAIAPYAPLLEVGAGSGYWSYEFRRAGVDIIATDPGTGRYRLGGKWLGWEPWLEVERLDGVTAVRRWPARALLMVWPDMEAWAAATLEAFAGSTVVYVGEGAGGCTADDRFHELLEERWALKEEIGIPQFGGTHDMAWVYQRAGAGGGGR